MPNYLINHASIKAPFFCDKYSSTIMHLFKLKVFAS